MQTDFESYCGRLSAIGISKLAIVIYIDSAGREMMDVTPMFGPRSSRVQRETWPPRTFTRQGVDLALDEFRRNLCLTVAPNHWGTMIDRVPKDTLQHPELVNWFQSWRRVADPYIMASGWPDPGPERVALVAELWRQLETEGEVTSTTMHGRLTTQ